MEAVLHNDSSTEDIITEEHATESSEMPSKSRKLLINFSANPSLPWYCHSVFRKYWEHYHKTMYWCRRHNETKTRINSQRHFYGFHNDDPFNFFTRFYHCSDVRYGNHNNQRFPVSTRQGHKVEDMSSTRYSRKLRKKKRKLSGISSCASQSSLQGQSSLTGQSSAYGSENAEGEEIEMEITEEMLNFFAKSQKHKELRDAKKCVVDADNEEGEYIDIEGATLSTKRGTVLPPAEQPGARRTSEMKLLYGKGAAMIHGMETAMQLCFDRNCDIQQPKLWPNMPLNLKF